MKIFLNNFFNSEIFTIVGDISILVTIFGFFFIIFLVIKGILPVLYRLGIGLSKRRIAIFANSEFESLKSMLIDSKIFKEKNILRINLNDLKKAEKESIFLVHWRDYKDSLKDILHLKSDATALIVYAPPDEGKVDEQSMININSQRNAIVVNFRGRLLNDILTSMITTSYVQK